ncbi:MAG: pyrroline-5-carboxylate reductase [Archaeoglobus sp.]|nr:pyrroline-5-carboxylate reductase [Archaeoglobus sp.]
MSKKNSDLSSVAIIGAGNLGSAIAKGLVGKVEVYASGRRKETLEELKKLGCKIVSSKDAASKAGVVFITVKPKDVPDALKEIREEVKNKKVVSFAAMRKLDELRELVPEARVFRAMTNVFAEYGKAFTVYYPSYDKEIEELLSNFGEVYLAKAEMEVDLMTAFSGSSPAFVAKFIQGFIYAGLSCGLTFDFAKKAALSIFEATAFALKDYEVEDLVKRITTPGGTTIQGIKKLEEHKVKYAIIDALEATVKKALD